MNQIGYRVKLNDYLDSEITLLKFLDDYFSLFDICEIKVNKCLEQSTVFAKNLPYIISRYGDKLSFHLNKNLITHNLQLSRLELMILSIVKSNDLFNNINFITHFNDSFDNNVLKNIVKHMKYFNNGAKLLLENAESNVYNITLLEQMLKIYNSANEVCRDVGLCIDFGHLFINGYNLNEVLNYFYSNNLFDNIAEYHFHNVKKNVAHQNIQDGIIDYKDVMGVINVKSANSRIIMEHEVRNMFTDGVNNVLYLKKKI